MTDFTTRPEISGTFGVVASTHWIATAVGFGILERGGNAFDAAVATGFTLQVVEPHLNGPGGEVPAIVQVAGAEAPKVLCGQGSAPAGATIEHYRAEGLDRIPGSGLLATVVPGAFDAWMVMLRDHGTMRLRDVLEPAIHYARSGYPLLARAAETIAGLADMFRDEWPSSAATWLPRDAVPVAGRLFCNPALADTWERIVTEAESAGSGREAQIEAARDAFYRGFVAATIDRYMHDAVAMDGSGHRRKGVLTATDMAGWKARWEPATSGRYRGWTVYKTGPWGQGPVLLQALGLLEQAGIGETGAGSEPWVHMIVEAIKLAFADREAYYGDPDFFDVPIDALLSRGHAEARARLIGATASMQQRPSRLPGLEHLADAAIARAEAPSDGPGGAGTGEPTMAHLANRRGDTVHLDVIDSAGNMVSATPSGGWLQSSPVVPGLGFALNSRAQMFWLEPGLPSSLSPGARPRTTLTPSLVHSPDGSRIALGTPGGDQQDQWQLVFLLRLIHGQSNLQAGIDAPLFHSQHFTSSFYPRCAKPGAMMIEPSFGPDIIDGLRARGHLVEVAEPWSIGRLTAAAREPDGLLRAAATPRLMQAYAVGR